MAAPAFDDEVVEIVPNLVTMVGNKHAISVEVIMPGLPGKFDVRIPAAMAGSSFDWRIITNSLSAAVFAELLAHMGWTKARSVPMIAEAPADALPASCWQWEVPQFGPDWGASGEIMWELAPHDWSGWAPRTYIISYGPMLAEGLLDENAVVWELDDVFDWGPSGLEFLPVGPVDWAAEGLPCFAMGVVDWGASGVPM